MDKFVKFPVNPTDGMVFEVTRGVYYAFDLQSNTWNRISSVASAVPPATPTESGLMVAADVQKINKLLVPPLTATLGSDNCPTRFSRGTVGFKSADNIVNVTGDALFTNVDAEGKQIAETLPFQVHENTYAYDFTIDMQELTDALIVNGNYVSKGVQGDRGPKGPTGEKGTSFVLSGPPGEQGEQGNAPECTLRVEPETFAVESGGKALVDVRVVLNECAPGTYKLEFDRQSVGQYAPVSKIKLKDASSKWVLGLTTLDGPSRAYYVDMTDIENTIKAKYLEELARLKAGYEKVTDYWLNQMNNLFNEQKRALCISLEYTESVRKNAQLRQHMESVAATAAVAGAKITLHTRNDPITSNTSGNTALNSSLSLQGQSAPAGTTGARFPQPPNTTSATQRSGGFVKSDAIDFENRNQAIPSQAVDTASDQFFVIMRGENTYISGTVAASGTGSYGGEVFAYRSYKGKPLGVSSWSITNDTTIGHYRFDVVVPGIDQADSLGDNFKTFVFSVPYERMNSGVHIHEDHQFSWEKYGNLIGSEGLTVQSATVQSIKAFSEELHVLDASLFFSSTNPLIVVAPEGTYELEIIDVDAFIDGKYRGDIRIVSGSMTYRLLNKGAFDSVDAVRAAYIGLTMDFSHRGGKIDFYIPSMDPTSTRGNIRFVLRKKSADLGYLQNVAIAAEIKHDYLRGLSNFSRCKTIGQDYVVICLSARLSKMLGYDGLTTVAFAWPIDMYGELAPLSGFEFGQDLDLQAQLVANVVEHAGECSPNVYLFAVVK